MSLKKTILITGTSSGIGHSLARSFHHRGYQVLATARKKESISDLEQLGITALALDVDSPKSIAALKEEVARITGGKLDMLVNNAGKLLPPCSQPDAKRNRSQSYGPCSGSRH
jgi:1-acylglycerone phosphate reductase